jgi:hypothetical protein
MALQWQFTGAAEEGVLLVSSPSGDTWYACLQLFETVGDTGNRRNLLAGLTSSWGEEGAWTGLPRYANPSPLLKARSAKPARTCTLVNKAGLGEVVALLFRRATTRPGGCLLPQLASLRALEASHGFAPQPQAPMEAAAAAAAAAVPPEAEEEPEDEEEAELVKSNGAASADAGEAEEGGEEDEEEDGGKPRKRRRRAEGSYHDTKRYGPISQPDLHLLEVELQHERRISTALQEKVAEQRGESPLLAGVLSEAEWWGAVAKVSPPVDGLTVQGKKGAQTIPAVGCFLFQLWRARARMLAPGREEEARRRFRIAMDIRLHDISQKSVGTLLVTALLLRSHSAAKAAVDYLCRVVGCSARCQAPLVAWQLLPQRVLLVQRLAAQPAPQTVVAPG